MIRLRLLRATITAVSLLASPAALSAQPWSFSMSTGATVPIGSYGVGSIGRSVSLGIGRRWLDEDRSAWRLELEGYDVLAPRRSSSTPPYPPGRIQSSGGLAFTRLQGNTATSGSRSYLLYGAGWHYVRGSDIGRDEGGPLIVRFGGGMRRQIGNLPPIRVEAHAMTWLKNVGSTLLIPVSIGMDF